MISEFVVYLPNREPLVAMHYPCTTLYFPPHFTHFAPLTAIHTPGLVCRAHAGLSLPSPATCINPWLIIKVLWIPCHSLLSATTGKTTSMGTTKNASTPSPAAASYQLSCSSQIPFHLVLFRLLRNPHCAHSFPSRRCSRSLFLVDPRPCFAPVCSMCTIESTTLTTR